jgi:hypothetical protein
MAQQYQPPEQRKETAPQKPGAENGTSTTEDGLQGEGNYAAAQRYRDELERFVKTTDIDKAAQDAAPRNQREAEDMAAAETKGLEHKKS